MRWKGRKSSSNLNDQRNMRVSGGGGAGGGMLRFLPVVFKFLGFKGTAVVAAGVIAYGLFTGNLGGVLGLQQPSGQTKTSSGPIKQSAEEQELSLIHI